MCIALISTTHPDYALIVVDNRDEFILRPTSRPHWWTHEPTGTKILSSRDLQRAEKGTWLGITDTGVFAVLTNYREDTPDDAAHPIHGKRSRGGMVTAWLGSGAEEETEKSVHSLVDQSGVKGIGGFSMVSGKLKAKKKPATNGETNGVSTNGDAKSDKTLEPIAIISNRCDHVHDVPWIGHERDQVYGLSNTSFDDPEPWPKVENGKRMVKEVIDKAIQENMSDDQLAENLLQVLDHDTLPEAEPGASFVDQIALLKHSIFIPPVGDEAHKKAMEAATTKGKGEWDTDDKKAAEELERPDPANTNMFFDTGMYGTQRQTVILVDWDGNVSYRERALWDSNGNPVEKGEGDVVFRFKIDGWDQ